MYVCMGKYICMYVCAYVANTIQTNMYLNLLKICRYFKQIHMYACMCVSLAVFNFYFPRLRYDVHTFVRIVGKCTHIHMGVCVTCIWTYACVYNYKVFSRRNSVVSFIGRLTFFCFAICYFCVSLCRVHFLLSRHKACVYVIASDDWSNMFNK